MQIATLDYNTRAIHPDDFAVRLYEANNEFFVELFRLHRLALINAPKDADGHLSTLSQCGLIKLAKRLEPYKSGICVIK